MEGAISINAQKGENPPRKNDYSTNRKGTNSMTKIIKIGNVWINLDNVTNIIDNPKGDGRADDYSSGILQVSFIGSTDNYYELHGADRVKMLKFLANLEEGGSRLMIRI